jgi:GTP-binding protein EngB required for normal cell division
MTDIGYGYKDEEEKKGENWLDQIIAYLHDKDKFAQQKVKKVV